MSDETKVGPALTAEEWKRFDPKDAASHCEANAVAYETDFHVMMAIANAALPDDDPRKITREDVRYLRDTALFLRTRVDEHGDDVGDPNLTALAAKLAALLPP